MMSVRGKRKEISILRKMWQKNTRIVSLITQCRPSMEGPHHLLRSFCWEIKGLSHKEIYISYKTRFNKAAWQRLRMITCLEAHPKLRIFVRISSKVPLSCQDCRRRGQLLRRNGGSTKEPAEEASSEGAAERYAVNRALLRYTECSRRRARPARASISSTWVVTIVCNTEYRDPKGKYRETPRESIRKSKCDNVEETWRKRTSLR